MYNYLIFSCDLLCGRTILFVPSRLCASCAPVSITPCQSPTALTGPTLLSSPSFGVAITPPPKHDPSHDQNNKFIRGMGHIVQRRTRLIEASRPACRRTHRGTRFSRNREVIRYSVWILPSPSSETTGLGGNATKERGSMTQLQVIFEE